MLMSSMKLALSGPFTGDLVSILRVFVTNLLGVTYIYIYIIYIYIHTPQAVKTICSIRYIFLFILAVRSSLATIQLQ